MLIMNLSESQEQTNTLFISPTLPQCFSLLTREKIEMIRSATDRILKVSAMLPITVITLPNRDVHSLES